MKPNIIVIDGLGGGIGHTVIEKIKETIKGIRIIAVGTNPVAAEKMSKAGADQVCFGEENVISLAEQADIIVGAMGLLLPNSLKGELTPNMASAICMSKAIKILIPMNKCGIKVATDSLPLSHHIDFTVKLVKEEIDKYN